MHIIILAILFAYSRCDEYQARRAKILDLEAKLTLGGNTTLTDKESIVNNCLMRHKFNEVDYGYDHPEHYNFSQHFFSYKDNIPHSKVYQIIKAMPKGAVLHIHDTAILGPDYMLNITYMDHLYVCFGNQTKFWFSNNIPNASCDHRWQLMSDVRHATKNIKKFDSEIRQLFTIVVKNPDVVYPSIKESWRTFTQHFAVVYPLLTYKPVWEQYLHDVLEAFREDNIMYAELRSSLQDLYELNGTTYDKLVTAKIYKTEIKKFVKNHPDFYGAKVIFAYFRKNDINTIDTSLQLVRNINKEVPELIAGFDLVGEEDLGKPLIEFVPVLENVKDLNFFFHAGETNWYGTQCDENLIDAVLLGAKRIGHAYALTKHPVIMKEVIERDIGLEVNVVSNTVLSLVRDVRNHPLSMFLSRSLPVVLSSDDPGAWEADPLSDDFYVAFVGVASRLSDLRMLKTLALNSLKYSALDTLNKQRAIRAFNVKWNHFVDHFNCSLY